MRFSKKALALAMSVVTVLSLMVGTLAYFTDRFDASASATAGTLDLSLVNDEITFQAPTSYRPGTGATIAFTLQNTGNKSVDVKETLVITANGKAIDDEFALYNAADIQIDGNGVVDLTGATPITPSKSGGKLIYAASEFILNGTGPNAETETEGNVVGAASQARSYVLVFTDAADNTWQSVTLTLDYEAQGKQHRNTNENTWTSVQTQTVSFAGDDAHKAVPVKPAA